LAYVRIGGVDRWVSFDCYGTLIDWNGGIASVLSRLWPSENVDELLAYYHAVEPVVQFDGSLTYRRVLERSLRGLAAVRDLPLADGEATALADSLPEWPPFPEVAEALTRLRAAGWKLAVLSNTDADFLDASIARLGVVIDERVVASEIGSYKPGHRHWDELERRTGLAPDAYVHVAASLFHDIEPCADLEITTVWINRLGERSRSGELWAAELPDLRRLPETLARLA
jgi:2-haloacid dehalogenase